MKKINALMFMVLFTVGGIACERTPLGHRANTVVSDGASDTSVVTSSATAIKTGTTTTTPTANDTSTQTVTKSDIAPTTSTATVTPTSTQTKTDTALDTATASGSKTDTSVPTATASVTATTVGTPFYIVSAVAEAVDAFGNAAPDVRSFDVQMSGMAQWVSVSIYEKQTQALFYSETVTGSPLTESLYMSPGKWTKGLSPNTTYNWVITAAPYAPDPNTHFPAAYTGEFTTDSFDPGTINVSFTTAVHYTGFTDAVPGQKDIWMGTVLVKNTTPHTVGLNGMSLAFKAWTPAVQATPYIDGSVGDYLTNCRITGWPNIESFGAPFVPSSTTSLNLSKILKPQDSQLFDVTCDVTDKQPQRTTKVAIEVVDQISSTAGFGRVVLGTTNGDPPQVYVLLVGKDDVASADPLPLYVRLSDNQDYPRIVMGNTKDNTIAGLEFFGANEKVGLTRLSFADYGDNGGDIESLRIFDGAVTLFCSGSINEAKSLDCANDAGLMTVDGVTPITIKANINQVSSSGERWLAASGDHLSGQLQVIRSATDSSKDGWFRAVGVSGRQYRLTYGGEKSDSTGFATGGPQITVRKTQPTVSAIALSESDQKLQNGSGRTVFRFSVTANSNGDVSLKHFVLARNIYGVKTDMYYLYENGGIAVPSWSLKLDDAGNLAFDFSTEWVIAAGTTKVFEVRADISGAMAGGTLTHTLIGDDSETSQNFLWSDNSASVHSLTSADWWNGYQVKGLPTVGQTLSQ